MSAGVAYYDHTFLCCGSYDNRSWRALGMTSGKWPQIGGNIKLGLRLLPGGRQRSAVVGLALSLER